MLMDARDTTRRGGATNMLLQVSSHNRLPLDIQTLMKGTFILKYGMLF
jgi:hypothetical protein